jgi:hypothetical protein
MEWAVVSRPETRVDGNSSPRAKKLVLQVSKARMPQNVRGQIGRGVVYHVNIVCIICKYNEILCSG